MKCIYCSIGKLKTSKTEDTPQSTIRYKKCTYCGANYKTIEKFIKSDKKYVKRNVYEKIERNDENESK